jgi:hypothetical protein
MICIQQYSCLQKMCSLSRFLLSFTNNTFQFWLKLNSIDCVKDYHVFLKWQGCEADHSPPTSVEVKKTQIYTSTPPTSSWCSAQLVEHRDNFTFISPFTAPFNVAVWPYNGATLWSKLTCNVTWILVIFYVWGWYAGLCGYFSILLVYWSYASLCCRCIFEVLQ